MRYHAYYMLQYEGTGKYVCQPTHSTRKIWWLLHISIAKTHQKNSFYSGTLLFVDFCELNNNSLIRGEFPLRKVPLYSYTCLLLLLLN